MVTDVSDDKLTVDVDIDVGALAHHAGYLRRINWTHCHSAHGVNIIDVSGQGVSGLPSGL